MASPDLLALSSLPGDAVLAPAASAQRGLWLTHLLDPGSTAYHVGHAYQIDGPLDVAALRNALTHLYARHEALRTSFVDLDGELHQVIHPRVDDALAVEPIAAESVADAVRAELDRHFDLGRPPLFRARLFTVDAGACVLTLVAHHMVADARSVEVVWEELAACYRAAVAGREPALPDLPLQYADYAAWEAEWLRSAEYEEHLRFFRHHLRDAPSAIELPLPVRPVPLWQGGTESMLLPADDTDGLLQLARRQGTTASTVTLAVFAAVLYRWTGQQIVVGIPASLREEAGLDHAVGMFVNSVAVPTRWDDDAPFEEAVRRIHATAVECLARRRCPFDHLVADLRPHREAGRSPIFQVMFSLAGGHTEPQLAGVSVREIHVPVRTAKFELSLDAMLADDRLRLELEWSAQRCNADAARMFLDHCRIAARYAARHPSMRVGQWPLGADDSAMDVAAVLRGDGRLDAPWPALAGSELKEAVR